MQLSGNIFFLIKKSQKMYLTAKQMLIGWDQVEGRQIFNNGELLK